MFRLTHLFDLSGRTALVTGGSSGVGLALARALGFAGARLLLVARRKIVLEEAAKQLHADGSETTIIVSDLEAPDGPDRAVAAAAELGSHVDILINAAGFNLRHPFQNVSTEDFDRHLAIHLRAPFRLTQLLAPKMAQRGWGRIVNIASLQSLRAFPDSAPYGAAKGGIVQLTRAIAEQWSKHGIMCNAIGPGFFPTDLTAPVFADPARSAEHAAKTAIGRNGELTDLYGAAVFLCSDASGYITGQTLFVDGGFSAK
jgi:NAD(P)-dependent dehydrogenase (short-subunit alcohol dehydrogenase family)